MKKIFLLLILVSSSCFAQQPFRFLDTVLVRDIYAVDPDPYTKEPERYYRIFSQSQFPANVPPIFWKFSNGIITEMNSQEKEAAIVADAQKRAVWDNWESDFGNSVKQERDELLAATDWTQLQDVPLSADQKAAWATYRQALRDLPENFYKPSLVIWPQVATETVAP